MPRMILLLALLSTLSCSGQMEAAPNPQATSYIKYAGQPPRAVLAPMTHEEQAKLQQVYSAVLKNNDSLDQEGDALWSQETDFRNALTNAMVKADPDLIPILQAQSSGSPPTSAQHDEILKAQSTVMQADPTLQSQWDDLTKKMTAHMQAVDAAMVKLDPTVADILAKLSP